MDKNIKTNSENMKSEKPLVSVMIATYNRADYIVEAIKSVQEQTYKNIEIIILDDCSTDNTKEIISQISKKDSRIIYYLQEKNVGIAENRNTCLHIAKGKYIAVLDSDDIWIDKEKLSKQIDFLENNPEYVMVGTWIKEIDEKGNIVGETKHETNDNKIRENFLARNQFAQSSLVYKLDIVKNINGYDKKYKVCDDYDLWLKVGSDSKNKLANIGEYSTGYRIHGGGITKTHKTKAAKEHLEIIKKYKNTYPGYIFALLKGILRVALSWI